MSVFRRWSLHCDLVSKLTYYHCLYFYSYEVLKKALSPTDPTKSASALAILFAGGMAGVANWAVAIVSSVCLVFDWYFAC